MISVQLGGKRLRHQFNQSRSSDFEEEGLGYERGTNAALPQGSGVVKRCTEVEDKLLHPNGAVASKTCGIGTIRGNHRVERGAGEQGAPKTAKT